MSCDVGKAGKGWIMNCDVREANEAPPGEVREVPVSSVKQRKGCRMTCDIGEAAEGLENEL